MVAKLGRRSGRKSSQVRNICFSLWTWKIVVVTRLGNTRRSRVQKFLKVWTRWKPYIQSQKENWGYQERGLVTALDLKTKVRSKNIKRQGMPSEMSAWRTFPTLSKSLKNCQCTLCEKDPQTWANFQLLSSSWVYRRVYVEIWWGQSARARRLCVRDCYVIER